jgi:hypothetical protein
MAATVWTFFKRVFGKVGSDVSLDPDLEGTDADADAEELLPEQEQECEDGKSYIIIFFYRNVKKNWQIYVGALSGVPVNNKRREI